MSALFGAETPAAPPPPPPAPPPPTVEDATAQAQQNADALRRRRGVAANIFAGGSTGSTSPNVATNALLGN